jgi:glycosyltransferase involved in cell wall biosynthesis
MKVLFIERRPTTTVSLEKVFREIASQLVEQGIDVEFQQVAFDNNLLGILKNILTFKPKDADIYHVTGHIHYISLVLKSIKTVLTIHDLRILHDRKGIRKWFIKKLFFDMPSKHLKFITTISDATKFELMKETSCIEAKIRVIDNPAFTISNNHKFKEFDEKRPTILQIGTAQHKNIPNLINAIKGLDCKLRIVGEIDANLSKLLRGLNFENVISLNDTEIQNEYSNADIVAFCSTYEGFGLPIIEAQAFSKPLITSNISPMKDVAGADACLVNPNDSNSIRKAINKIISDKVYREHIVLNGLENIKRFDSKKIATQYLDLYREISNQ